MLSAAKGQNQLETKKFDTHHELACDSAEEFISSLDAISRQSNLTRGHSWLWRGVGDAENHSLRASALRSEGCASLIEARNLDARPGGEWSGDRCSDFDRAFLEWASVSLFYRYANQQALQLPPLSSDLHNLLMRPADAAAINLPFEFFRRWPPRELWPVLGLAQHYGVITRLLDWTRNPYVAAYAAPTW